jgi:hypothetical protein
MYSQLHHFQILPCLWGAGLISFGWGWSICYLYNSRDDYDWDYLHTAANHTHSNRRQSVLRPRQKDGWSLLKAQPHQKRQRRPREEQVSIKEDGRASLEAKLWPPRSQKTMEKRNEDLLTKIKGIRLKAAHPEIWKRSRPHEKKKKNNNLFKRDSSS